MNFAEIGVEFTNFVEIGGNMQYASLAFKRGMALLLLHGILHCY